MFVIDPKDILGTFLFELVIGRDLDRGAFDENYFFAAVIALEQPGSNLCEKYITALGYLPFNRLL